MKLQSLLKGRSPERSTTSQQSKTKDTSSATAVSETSSKETAEDTSTTQDKETAAPTIDHPTQYDVLFGRGKPYQGHEGNIRLHKIVDLYKGRYVKARRHEKTEIAEEIVQFIKSGGAKAGRFLKRVDGEETWTVVCDSIARDKVSHALRGKPRKGDQQPSNTASPSYPACSVSLESVDTGVKRRLSSNDDSIAQLQQENNKKQKLSDPRYSLLLESLASLQQQQNGTIAPLSTTAADRGLLVIPPASAVSQLIPSYSSDVTAALRVQLLASALAKKQLAEELVGSVPLAFQQQPGGISGLFQAQNALQPSLFTNTGADLSSIIQNLAAERTAGFGNRTLW